MPLQVVLTGEGEFFGRLDRKGYLIQRAKDFFQFDAWHCQGFGHVDGGLSVGNAVVTGSREKSFAPIDRVTTGPDIEWYVTDSDFSEGKGIQQFTVYSAELIECAVVQAGRRSTVTTEMVGKLVIVTIQSLPVDRVVPTGATHTYPKIVLVDHIHFGEEVQAA